jgi:hypothetical protein
MLTPAQVQIAGIVLPAGSYRAVTPEDLAMMRAKHEAVKAEMKAERLTARDWLGYLLLVDRRDRLASFLDIKDRMTDAQYWQMLGDLWTDTEVPGRWKGVWLGLFDSKRTNRHALMSPEEHAALAALPSRVQLYRGAPPHYARGMSWTTDSGVAHWFANRFQNGGVVYTAKVEKSEFLGYFLARKEFEAVINPRNMRFKRLADDAPASTEEAA